MTTLLEIGLSNAVLATLLAAAAFVVGLVYRNPRVMYVLWLLVLVKLVTPPLVNVGVPVPEALRWKGTAEVDIETELTRGMAPQNDLQLPPLEAAPTAGLELDLRQIADLPAIGNFALFVPEARVPAADKDLLSEINATANEGDIVWPIISGVWLAGSVAWLLVAAWRTLRFRRLLRKARPGPPEVCTRVCELAGGMGLRRAPAVRWISGRTPPAVWMIFSRPMILLPQTLFESLDEEQRELLLLHELAHLARRDQMVRWLELAVLCLYWWHPVAWWARRQVQTAQEACCDATVLAARPTQAATYAETLLATVDFLSLGPITLPVGASPFGEARQFKRRFQMILAGTTPKRLTWAVRVVLLAIALLVVPCSLTALWAEPETDAGAPTEAEKVEAKASKPSIETRPKEDKEKSSLEARIERMEKAIQKLTSTLDAQALEGAPAATYATKEPLVDQRAEPTRKSGEIPTEISEPRVTDVGVAKSFEALEVAAEEYQASVEQQVLRQKTYHETLLATNSNRSKAAHHQNEAVNKAYSAGTVTLDLLLEAQRRDADARLTLGQSIFNLAKAYGEASVIAKAKLEFLKCVYELRTMQVLRAESLAVWKLVNNDLIDGKPSSSDQEAQARDQYFLAQKRVQDAFHQAQNALKDFKEAGGTVSDLGVSFSEETDKRKQAVWSLILESAFQRKPIIHFPEETDKANSIKQLRPR